MYKTNLHLLRKLMYRRDRIKLFNCCWTGWKNFSFNILYYLVNSFECQMNNKYDKIFACQISKTILSVIIIKNQPQDNC